MQVTHDHSVEKFQQHQQNIAISATFTAEPIEESLAIWMQELNIPSAIQFAPYNQIFQQLLDPSSLLSQNQHGINIVLLRFEDWRRTEDGSYTEVISPEEMERNVQELVMALKSAASRSASPQIVCFCPASPAARADASLMTFFQQMQDLMVSELSNVSGLHLLASQDLNKYPVEDYYDLQGDRIGHIPFTPLFFTALGTALARKIYALKSKPSKVIVLDCDNTLWKGVVGEDGVMGIEMTPDYKALQEFMVAQQKAGMLICLCSKNNEADVLEAFNQRFDMPLKIEQIVSWSINWLPKSENIKSLAQELNLGLDSFIFIDDNPIECAEVQTNCPEVLTLQLPVGNDISRFLNHVWAFDRLNVTEEDKQRTAMYKQNVERSRFQKEAMTLEQFLAGIALKVEISEPSSSHLPRISQLTQRTNQFNFTTLRRSEGEIKRLSDSGLECRMVEVSDRFGDHGLVGVMIFASDADAIKVDTFLLSCRVLGRGVEHRMLTELAEIAKERNLSAIDISYIRTQKNLPALNFLESVASNFKQTTEDGYRFLMPVEFAAAISYTPGTTASETLEEAPIVTTVDTVTDPLSRKNNCLSRIATELYEPEQILRLVELQQQASRPQLEGPFVLPQSEIEKQLAKIWSEVMRLEVVGIHDSFFELGGTSLLAVRLLAEIERVLGRKLHIATIFQFPTIEQLAKILSDETEVSTSSPRVSIQPKGSKPPLFFIHVLGEGLQYCLPLVSHLGPDQPVYGLAVGLMSDEEIEAKLADVGGDVHLYYLKEIRSIQPHGPYFLAGILCGGRIAYDIASQLHAQGEEVGLVALIQTLRDVTGFKKMSVGEKLGAHWNNLLHSGPDYGIRKAKGGVRKAKKEFQILQWKLRKLLGLTLPQAYYDFTYQKAMSKGHAKFVEMREQNYPGRAVLFRARESVAFYDSKFGWGDQMNDKWEIYDIPGSESNLLQEPPVKLLAEKLTVDIDAALAKK